MPGRTLGLALLAALLVFTTAACGRDDGVEESRIIGDSLTVYSSLPLQGPLAPVARDIVRAEKLALREARGRAGGFNVNYVSLDSSDPESGAWDAGRVAANARRAVQTPNTIAYLGELEPGASAISLPIINEAGVLQVSPRDTFAGLTEPGATGEPQRYYPSGVVNFARVVPPSDREAEVLVAAMATDDVRRLTLADDGRPAGADLRDRVARLAERNGIEVAGSERADAYFYAGAPGDGAIEALRRVHEAAPRIRLYAGDEFALAPGIGRRVGAAAERLQIIGVEPGESAGFVRRFEDVYGDRPERQAVLGYRAMRLVLDAVARSGADAASRREVIRRAVGAAGTLRSRFARYRFEDGALVMVRPRM